MTIQKNQNGVAQKNGVRANLMNHRTRVDSRLEKRRRCTSLPWWKRATDVVGASLGLVLLSPLMISVAVYIKLVSRGPILFKHKRFGYLGQPLYVWKFRSMHVHVDPSQHQQHVIHLVNDDGQLKKLDSAADLIPLGKWLRCTALDELPQLFNVLKGEMSLVGPRPDVIPRTKYQEWQQVRFDVLPGLTGLWQVSGKNETTFNEMNELDVAYVENRNFWLDLKIVFWTVPAILDLVATDFTSKNTAD